MLLGTDVLPAGSVSTAVKALEPDTSGVLGCSFQVPSAATVVLPRTWVPVLSVVETTIRSPAVPVPLITGRESSVWSPLLTLPVTSPTLSSTPVITGAVGAV